jgi:hypothetical protein
MRSIVIFIIISVVSLALFSSCQREIFSLNVKPEALHLRSTEDHPVLSATVQEHGGEEIEVSDVEWSTSDPNVVVIDKKGRVTVRGSGEATIFAKTKADEKEVKVQVVLSSLR